MELDKARNEVFRRIGRNVFIYQQLEHLLKSLIVHSRLEGGVSDIAQKTARRSHKVGTQTLGQSVSAYFETMFSEREESEDFGANLEESAIDFKFTIGADAEAIESRKQALASIRDDRNQLIHHLLPRLKIDSVESWNKIGEELDQQREKILPEFESLKVVARSLDAGRKATADFISSAEGIRLTELAFLQQSPVVSLLEKVAVELARPDGWTPLARAGKLLWEHEPELMVGMNEIYGYKTLKALISASELFDVLEEPLQNGGNRALYRTKM